MRALPPLTAGRVVSAWHFDVAAAIAVAVLVASYLVAVRVARRRGVAWPWWRVAAFVGLGGGSIVVATMSSLGVYEHVVFWPAAVQITLLLAVTPLCLGMGDPLGLIAAALPAAMADRWWALLASKPLRILTFPAVGAILATASQFVVFFTGYLGAAMKTPAVLDLLQLQVVVTGCLFALPLLGVETLPPWCTQPIRMAFAGLDGLLDAVPGIAVISASGAVGSSYYLSVHPAWAGSIVSDQQIGGGLMITLAEVIAVPFVAVLFRAWIKEDAAKARVIDQRLDEASRPVPVQVSDGEVADTGRDKPWWETDPGPLADRARRYGWSSKDKPDNPEADL